MSGSPFETVREDPFKARADKNGTGRAKRMPKGITPPISDPFNVSAPTHAQAYFNPLQSKSTRARLSQTAEVRALTAAAAASAQARAARERRAETRGNVEALRAEAPADRADAGWTDPLLVPKAEVAPLAPLFAAPVEKPRVEPEEAIVLAADGHGPAPQHPAGPQPSSSAAAYYGEGKGGGGNGGGSGGGSDDGGEGRVEPVQDDIVAGVLVAAFALLFGWLGYNAVMGPDSPPEEGDGLLAPQSTETTQIEDLGAPNPFPPGPIDIRPTSPIEAAPDDAQQTQLRSAAETEPLQLAEAPAEVQPAAEPAAPPPPVCASGRAMRAYFCTAKADMTPVAREAMLSEIREWGACATANELVVSGYADTRGAVAMNANLAASRASSVAALLRERGLSVTEVDGVGELTGIEDEQNCANQRRVDVYIKGDPPPPSLACSPPAEARNMICP